METLPELQRLVGEALAVLLQLAAARAQGGQGGQSDVARSREAWGIVARTAQVRRHGDEALYWRARLAEAEEGREALPGAGGASGGADQSGIDARMAAGTDYVALLRRLPKGRLRREVEVRLAALGRPGEFLSPDEVRAASRRNLARTGRALHAYAADHGGRLPRALEDLLGEYLTDPITLVRPGAGRRGGGRAYVYQAGIVAEIDVAATGTSGPVKRAGGVPVVAWEPVAGDDGTRLALRVDGEVVRIQE